MKFPLRVLRTMQAKKHVKTFDQIQSEKSLYETKGKLSNSDPLSKIFLVYGSILQF